MYACVLVCWGTFFERKCFRISSEFVHVLKADVIVYDTVRTHSAFIALATHKLS